MRVTGILTVGNSSLTLDGSNDVVQVGTALTLGHTQGLQFHTQNLHADGFEVNNINVSGVLTSTSFIGDLEGNVTGAITGDVTGNLTGTVNSPGIVTATTFVSTNGSLSNFYAGYLAGSSASGAVYNTGVGYNALQDLTSGDYNTVFGANSGQNLTTGWQNTIIGSYTGDTLTTGYQNVLMGVNAGGGLDAGRIRNTFIGSNAGQVSFNGDYSTSIGVYSSYDAEGDYVVSVGAYAGYSNNGSGTVHVGAYSGYQSDVADYSIMVGYTAGYYMEGSYNVAIGYRAMNTHDNGGDYNIAIGYDTKYYDSGDSSYNIAIGFRAIYGNSNYTNGDYNVALGYQAGYSLQSGSYNLLLGNGAGDSITTGSNNVVIVAGPSITVDVDSATADGQLIIGYGSTAWVKGSSNVELNYEGSKKLETTAGGVTVTGNVTATNFTGNLYSTGISTISGFRFPSSDGTDGQVLGTDGNGNLSFITASTGSGGAGAATTISDQNFTATQGQTNFTSSQDLTDKSIQVFLNGVKLRGSADYSVSVPTTLTLTEGANVGDVVNLVVSYGYSLDEENFTATEGQTTFDLAGALTSSENIKVYVNGTKLRKAIDYGTSASVTLVSGATEGDEIDLVCDNAEDYYTATEGQTVFIPTSSDISGENLQVFLNGVKLKVTDDYSVGSPAITLTTGLVAGDEVDVVITRS